MVKETIQRMGFLLRLVTRRKLDALDLLEAEHMRVDLLLLQWRLTSDREGLQEIFSSLSEAVSFHFHLEEDFFYPECRKNPELAEFIAESLEEHHQIDVLLKEIAPLSPNSARAIVKMKSLMENFKSHVRDEENDLFPRVRKIFKKPQLEKLLRQFKSAKQVRTRKQKAA